MKSSLKNMVVVLFLITFIGSAAVGVVYQLTLEPIRLAKENKLKESLQQVLPPFKEVSEPQLITLSEGGDVTVYTAYDDEGTVGYAIETFSNKGYGGQIKLLVGFMPDGSINKIATLSHSETPGLGAKISDKLNPFVVQFQGINPAATKMSVKKNGGDIDAITASTITSSAYIDAVVRAFNEVSKQIKK